MDHWPSATVERAGACGLVLLVLLASVRLWGENLWVRVYHHQFRRTRYDRSKRAWLHRLPPLPEALRQQLLALADARTHLQPSVFTARYGAFHSSAAGGATYWNHLAHDAAAQRTVDCARQWVAGRVQDVVRAPVYAFDFSMWHCFFLKYVGEQGRFGWHYDSEDPDDVRALYCLSASDGAGHVEYIDETGAPAVVALAGGEGYALRGSTTFHRVTPNRGGTDHRTMVGFHFSRTPHKTSRNLCYLGNITGWRPLSMLRHLSAQIFRERATPASRASSTSSKKASRSAPIDADRAFEMKWPIPG